MRLLLMIALLAACGDSTSGSPDMAPNQCRLGDCHPDAGTMGPLSCGPAACGLSCIRPEPTGGFFCSQPCNSNSECPSTFPCCNNAGGQLSQKMCVFGDATGSCP